MCGSKKIKLFLTGYVNFPNAQNINCDNIARYIDKDKFEVHVFYTPKMPVDKQKYKKLGIRLHRLIHHRYIWHISKFFSMWITNCDVYYMCKAEPAEEVFMKLFKSSKKKKFVTSIEGVVDDTISCDWLTNFFKKGDSVISISNFIREDAKKKLNIESEVIPLGVNEQNVEFRKRNKIEQVIWVGNVNAGKYPKRLLEVAKIFPNLRFTMIGDGDMDSIIEEMILEQGINNIIKVGRVPNEDIYRYMNESDILLMTSEYEGVPKVIQEAAVCGVPSIYIANNYKLDFIIDGISGFEVHSVEEMKNRLKELIDNSELYRSMTNEAYKGIQPYLWKDLIREYENFFRKLVDRC